MAKKSRGKTVKTTKKAVAPAAATKKATTHTPSAAKGTAETTKPKATVFDRLQKWNMTIAVFMFLQAMVLMLIAKDTLFPVQLSYSTPDLVTSGISNHAVNGMAVRHIVDVHLVHFIAYFLLISAVVHGMAATFYRFGYDTELKQRLNRMRWIGFGLSASLMTLCVALVTGVHELTTLIALAVLGPIGAAAGLLTEQRMADKKGASGWLQFIAILTIVAAFAVGLTQIIGITIFGSGGVPGFIYGVYASLAALAVAGVLHFRSQMAGKGKWADYIFVERGYIILEIIGLTALAWQLFAGALRS